jgi:methyltransferase (TIGR00027 family)
MSSFFIFVIQRMLETLGRLTLPNLSSSVGVARLRYIQSVRESPEHKNPDTLVGEFLSRPVRWLSMLQAKLQLSKLRSHPFYYYLIARTVYYDRLFVDAVGNNIKYIINIGCGTDTRSHRFNEFLEREKVSVIECDQSSSITVKQKLAKEMWCTRHVAYVSIDLNAEAWPDLVDRLGEIPSTVLVMLEGVSSYVNDRSFAQFLGFLADKLKAGSQLAYDYKIAADVDDAPDGNQVKGLFRLPSTREKVAAYHKALGYELSLMELSSDLTLRLLPDLLGSNVPLFTEDCLLQLTVTQRAK